jgi:hypothetical protein
MDNEVGDPKVVASYEHMTVEFTHRQLFELLSHRQGIKWIDGWRLRSLRFMQEGPLQDDGTMRASFDMEKKK